MEGLIEDVEELRDRVDRFEDFERNLSFRFNVFKKKMFGKLKRMIKIGDTKMQREMKEVIEYNKMAFLLDAQQKIADMKEELQKNFEVEDTKLEKKLTVLINVKADDLWAALNKEATFKSALELVKVLEDRKTKIEERMSEYENKVNTIYTKFKERCLLYITMANFLLPKTPSCRDWFEFVVIGLICFCELTGMLFVYCTQLGPYCRKMAEIKQEFSECIEDCEDHLTEIDLGGELLQSFKDDIHAKSRLKAFRKMCRSKMDAPNGKGLYIYWTIAPFVSLVLFGAVSFYHEYTYCKGFSPPPPPSSVLMYI